MVRECKGIIRTSTEQQSRHERALGGRWAGIKTWMLFQHNRDAVILVRDNCLAACLAAMHAALVPDECSAAVHAILAPDDSSAAMHAILVLDE